MRYYRLFDHMSPRTGDLYRVDPETGRAWMVTDMDTDPIPAFVLASQAKGTTQFQQLQDYASKNGRLEEEECPVS